jgi:hypothetical protein
MAGRVWDTKKLAQRIDPNYFKNPKKLRTIHKWSLWGSVILTAIGLAWLAGHLVAGMGTPFTAGPILSSHAAFSQKCVTCHAANTTLTAKVSDQICDTCHDGPVHQLNAASPAPACKSCHVEHRGLVDLTRTDDRYCTTCHSNLQTRNGVVKVTAHINSFTDGHPDFEVLAPGTSDPGTIKFNHAVHLNENLRAGFNQYVNLECTDCHRAAGNMQTWPYGHMVADAETAALPLPHARASSKAYMAPVNYYEHCSNCHPLEFDAVVRGPVPHKKPEVVHAFVVQKLNEYVQQHPQVLRMNRLDERISTQPPMPTTRTAAEWVAQHTATDEYLLWTKTCKECHTISFQSGSPLPVIAKAQITRRWLMKGNFDHQAHLEIKCDSCHSKVRSSKLTSDVLIPGIATCQACHIPRQRAAASGGCYECHVYHDWTKEKPVHGKYDIQQLTVSKLMVKASLAQ